MMARLEEQARAMGEVAARRAAATLATRMTTPGVSASAADGNVTLRGRGLARRMLTDARLRWIGGMLR